MSCHRRSTGQHTITPFLLGSDSSRPDDSNRPTDQPPPGSSTSPTQESRSPPDPSPDLSRSSSARSARRSSSFLPSFRLAGFSSDRDRDRRDNDRRSRDMRSRSSKDSQPKPKPKPLLVLKLSGSSFLDTVIRDDKTKDPLYILETSAENTSIYRLDHIRDEPIKAATVQWPVHPVRVKNKSGRSIQFGIGSWREAEDVLKNGPLGNTAIRKFNLPHYPNSLKWKLIPGNCFCCVTNAIKGPVAVLDAATLSAPPRLKIYDSLIDKETARSQDNYKGIPTILLDYLITTALLLVTDVQEWLDRPREARIPGGNSYTVQRWLALIHHRPAPPEPDHPTVDLSLTVSSTPPHSATIPSPGGIWETRSGVTSLSGSNGSGSGASYLGDPFTPTTPATPVTPATSYSRSMEEVPPVPPVPGSSSSSPFAFNTEPSQARERHKSNPQSSSHSPSSSTSTMAGTRHPQTLSLPASGDDSLLSQSAPVYASVPASPHPPTSAGPSTASSSSSGSRFGRRQLPIPPAPPPPNSFAQPWLYPSSSSSSTSPTSTLPPSPSTSCSAPGGAGISAARAAARASMRGSLRTAIPPPAPPPQGSIPLPPKLAQEHQGYAAHHGHRPHTAPELEDASRRRHSASEFGRYMPPMDEDLLPASMHPYAQAYTYTSVRGREVNDRDDLPGQMRELSVSGAGPSAAHSSMHAHIRAPSQPAPDYDRHSFANMAPPMPALPPLPTPQGATGSGMRSPQSSSNRRVLTVVNGDANLLPTEDPGRVLPGDRRVRQQQQPRMSAAYADSVYEMPPPAYDAIDFSVPPVRHLPRQPPVPLPQARRSTPQLPLTPLHSALVTPTPLPMPPLEAGGEGQRGS
ncbi:hypothetical protein GSI_01619 [Ganoderma sinense ZZ0214-1]|uniref:Uncharacterized protein n=1 Tax=Ganoderma sinense ZZ0214-1 TaxID=1077348 RepID=A0A2G8SQA8_9APHY|nr:hypothetical protein GSI_01619 [Ganoderma sinense ZZ0214-1]